MDYISRGGAVCRLRREAQCGSGYKFEVSAGCSGGDVELDTGWGLGDRSRLAANDGGHRQRDHLVPWGWVRSLGNVYKGLRFEPRGPAVSVVREIPGDREGPPVKEDGAGRPWFPGSL